MNWLGPTVSGCFAALSCFAWWRISRALRPFMKGPTLDEAVTRHIAAAEDMADALAERRDGERHWTAGGR